MQIDAIDVLLTSGFLGTLVTVVAKWLHDRKKAPLEREQILSSVSEQNVNSALAIAAEARATAQSMKEQYQEDAKRDREHHAREMAQVVERLTRVEDRNRELTREVDALKREDEAKARHIATQDARISRLEGKLGTARQKIVELLEYIKDHTTGTEPIPVVDLSLFEK